MDRERAETHLRVLAEAELRAAIEAVPVSGGRWAADRSDASFARMARVARALTDVHALDVETAEAILAGFAAALGARQRTDLGRLMVHYESSLRKRLVRAPWFAWPSLGSQAGPGPGAPGSGRPDRGGPARLVPLGLTAWYRGDGMDGELHLLSYSRTASGARFTVAWRLSSSGSPGGHPLPAGLFGVTDDKGGWYSLSFTGCGGPDWAGEIRLRPDPPDDARWFDLTPPGGPALRVDVTPDNQRDGACPQVRETDLDPGEYLLNRTAERLLIAAQDFRPDPRAWPAGLRPGPLTGIASGLGDVVAALEAAGALSAVSPVPGRLAALCASLGLSGHGITAPPAHDLPEPWLSLRAHYHRRKPEPVPVWDGFAAVAAALPELDGISLALLGLHTAEGRTVLHLRASSPDGAGELPGPDFPLSVWVRDSGGRWHATQQDSWAHDDRESAFALHLVPPLTRSTAWIELLAAGPSAEVSARLPLRWGAGHDLSAERSVVQLPAQLRG
jgi:hypothetical protein